MASEVDLASVATAVDLLANGRFARGDVDALCDSECGDDLQTVASLSRSICTKLEAHTFMPAALGSGAESLQHKTAALVHALRLESSSNESLARLGPQAALSLLFVWIRADRHKIAHAYLPRPPLSALAAAPSPHFVASAAFPGPHIPSPLPLSRSRIQPLRLRARLLMALSASSRQSAARSSPIGMHNLCRLQLRRGLAGPRASRGPAARSSMKVHASLQPLPMSSRLWPNQGNRALPHCGPRGG